MAREPRLTEILDATPTTTDERQADASLNQEQADRDNAAQQYYGKVPAGTSSQWCRRLFGRSPN